MACAKLTLGTGLFILLKFLYDELGGFPSARP